MRLAGSGDAKPSFKVFFGGGRGVGREWSGSYHVA